MLFEGYGRLLWNGTLETIQLSLLSLLLAFVIGLLGAAAKLSRHRWLSLAATIYTTLIRGVPAVPKGQLEAAAAFGLTPWQVFRRILFPQMMRFALPGISNNWQVILKATALVSIIGLHEVVRAAQDAITGTSAKGAYLAFFFISVVGVIYLVLTTLSNLVFMALERRYSVGIRKPEL